VGDEFYGPFGEIKLSRSQYEALRLAEAESDDPVSAGSGRHALHAHRLEFEHPILGGRTAFESPWPADLAAMCD